MADPIADLTNQMKQMREGGVLQLSGEAISRCKASAKALHTVLVAQSAEIDKLTDFVGSAGYDEGNKTRQNLIDDTNAIKKLLDDYIKYLDEFSDAVTNTVGSLNQNA